MTDERWDELVETAVGGPVTRGSMFGSQGLRTGRRFFAIWWQAQLVVKLPADRIEEVVDAGQGAQFEPMAGRKMGGWVVLQPSAGWPALIAEARAHVESQSTNRSRHAGDEPG